MTETRIADVLACPHPHRKPLVERDGNFGCSDPSCEDSIDAGGFLRYRGVPVLIDFSSDTICDRERYVEMDGGRDVYVARSGKAKELVERFLGGTNPVTRANCNRFVAEVKQLSPTARVLIIGSGEQGQGTAALWSDGQIERVGIDIYPTSTTMFIADGHELPFGDGVFQGVWIQAVLEHVADPRRVVAEIERVLQEGGVVYAETPFMQQVHEGAYDFQRFSATAHRFLFRKFVALTLGGTTGPGVVLAWSLRYFLWGLLRSRTAARLIYYPASIILRLFDKLMDPRASWDGPSGTFFLGRKVAGYTLSQRELIGLYEGFQR